MKKYFTIGFFLALALLVANKAEAVETATSSPDLACTVIGMNLCPDATNEYCPSSHYKSGPTNDYKDFIDKSWKPVSLLQKFLTKTGYLKSGSVTGTYGPLTKAAITKFQKDYNLKTDWAGYAGPQTRGYIKKLSCGLDKVLPDLVILKDDTNPTGIKIATTTNPFAIVAEVTIKNIGYDSASSTLVHEFTATGGGTATLATSTCATKDLHAGERCNVSYNIVFTKGGNKELVFKADKKNKVKESNENNNTAKAKITLSSSGVVVPPSGKPVIKLEATPDVVTATASSSKIEWNISNAIHCQKVGSNWPTSATSDIGATGSTTVSNVFVNKETKFKISCTGAGGIKSEKEVKVTKNTTTPPTNNSSDRYIKDIDLDVNNGSVFKRYDMNGKLSGNVLSIWWKTDIGADKPVTVTLINEDDSTVYKFAAKTYSRDVKDRYYVSFDNQTLTNKGLTYGTYKAKINITRGDGVKEEGVSSETIELEAGTVTVAPTISNIVLRNETVGKDVGHVNKTAYYVGVTKMERQYHITWSNTGFTIEPVEIILKDLLRGTSQVLSMNKLKVSDGRYDFSGATFRSAEVAVGDYKLIVKSGSVSAEMDLEVISQ